MDSFNKNILTLHQLGHKGKGIFIGQLDTGVDGKHPAFVGRIASFRQFGYRGMVKPSMSAHDSGWHGTHIAGLLVGHSKDKLLGIAPEAELYSGMVLEEGHIVTRILKGLDWLLESKVQVVNLSLGVFTDTPIFQSLIQEMIRREIVVICSIGNRGAGKASVPGIYPEVISVGAAGIDGRVCSFSGSYHHDNTMKCFKPDLLAPGEKILSTLPNNNFEEKSGTSMASAQVAGLATLLCGAFPKASASTIKNALIKSCSSLDPQQNHRSANGRVCPLKSFEILKQWKQYPPTISNDSYDWKLKTKKKHIDPRLVNQLEVAGEQGNCEAVLQFKDFDGIKNLEQLAITHYDQNDLELNFSKLKNAPIAIYRGSTKDIRTIIDWPSVKIANACDINKYAL